MKPYLGFRGSSLSNAVIWLVVCPAFLCYGYNMAVAGGLLTLESFNNAFPQMDTIHTTGAEQHYNSKIQGQYAVQSVGAILTVATEQARSLHFIPSGVFSAPYHVSTWVISGAAEKPSLSLMVSPSSVLFLWPHHSTSPNSSSLA